MNRLARAALLMILPLAGFGAWLGWWAGPWLARGNYLVQVGDRVWREETQSLSVKQLVTEARAIQGSFRLGGALLGLFIGLVAGLKIFSIHWERTSDEYEADRADCLACGRCFLYCPVERERLEAANPGVLGTDRGKAT
jgi:NAD-dependent dihydropyrimidine dehydrogenase PreA subunit